MAYMYEFDVCMVDLQQISHTELFKSFVVHPYMLVVVCAYATTYVPLPTQGVLDLSQFLKAGKYLEETVLDNDNRVL